MNRLNNRLFGHFAAPSLAQRFWSLPIVIAVLVPACLPMSKQNATHVSPVSATAPTLQPQPTNTAIRLVAEPTAKPKTKSTVKPRNTPVVVPTADTESVIHYVTAHNLMDRGEYAQAERRFKQVIELEPGFARGWEGRGRARMFQKDYEDALADFDKAIVLKPKLAPAFANRAFTKLALGDWRGATNDSARSISLDPRYPDGFLVQARLRTMSGDLNGALEDFNRAVALAPDQGAAYWWRGRFHQKTGNFEAALADFNLAIQLAPSEATIFMDRAGLRIQADIDVDLAVLDLKEAISLSEVPRRPEIIDEAEYQLRQLGIDPAAID